MVLARLFIFGVPLAAAALTWWSAQQARASRATREGEIVAMLPGAPPALNPFAPATEVDRQIVDLIHEPLIRIGADGRLKAALASQWKWSQTLTCWFADPARADQAAAHLKALNTDQWITWGLESVETEREKLVMRFTSMDGRGPEAAARELADLPLQTAEIIRIDLSEAARPYHEHFKTNAAQASQMKRVWFDGMNSMEILVVGDVPGFVREITNYYNAKPSLRPRISSRARITVLREPVLEFVLHDNSRWHDGTEVTADDVCATHKYAMSQAWPVPNGEALRDVQAVEAIGRNKVRVLYRRASGAALCGWINLPILPAAWMKSHPSDPGGHAFTEGSPPGAGLYMITHRDLASLALAPADPSRVDHRAQRITFASGASEFQTRLGFATGVADLFWPEEDEISTLLKGRELAIRAMPPRNRLLVLWNTRAPILSDIRVREALSLATDRQSLVEGLLHGRGRIQEGLFQPGLWFAQKFHPPRFDLGAGRELLGRSGWVHDVEGIARRPGQRLAFELLTTEGNPRRQKLAETLAAQWRKLGARVTVTPLPWNELIDHRLARRQFDAAIIGLDFETTWDQFPFWHSSQAPAGGGLNFAGIEDRQIDLLLQGLREEFDPARVPARAKELEDKLLALHPMLPLFTDMTQVAVSLSALPPGARVDDLAPWTLRDLVSPAAARPAKRGPIRMLMPDDSVPVPAPAKPTN